MFPATFPLINILHKVISFHSTLSAAPPFFPSLLRFSPACCPSGPHAVTPPQGPPVPAAPAVEPTCP